MGIKLNLGASPIWNKPGWHTMDHKLLKSEGMQIAGDIESIDLPDESCDIVFCSHVFEHIPHLRLPAIISEINRVLCPGGILRLLTPDLEIITKAYVEKDEKFFQQVRQEDESIRTDLGLGGMLMNFIVSPGQDTVLLDRKLRKFISGYAHLYCYDFQMLSMMLEALGFKSRQANFNDSEVVEMTEPLHVVGFDAVWQNFNQDFYKKNGLIHQLNNGKYEINFKVTGFDRDPLTSLIIEAKKMTHISKEKSEALFNKSTNNYNRYGYSLLADNDVKKRLDDLDIAYPK